MAFRHEADIYRERREISRRLEVGGITGRHDNFPCHLINLPEKSNQDYVLGSFWRIDSLENASLPPTHHTEIHVEPYRMFTTQRNNRTPREMSAWVARRLPARNHVTCRAEFTSVE